MASFSSLVIQNIVDSLSVGLMVISHDGKIVFLNNAACNILGLECEKHLGYGWGELFITDESTNTEFNQVIIDVIATQEIGLKSIVPFWQKGHECPKQLSITSSFLTEDGTIAGMVFLFDDVTEAYEAQEREKRILQRNSELQDERISGLDSLAQAVAHQVLNPVMVIGGMANLVSRKLPDADPLKHDVQVISEEALKLEGLVAAVHSYSNIPKPVTEEIEAISFFNEALLNANRILERIGERIEMQLECAVSKIIADRELLLTVIVELLLNSSNFTPEKITDVKIQVERKGGEAIIRVIDHGMGIENIQLKHIYDPFYSTKAKGVGMGLSRAKKIIFEHSGKLKIESAGYGQGATVIIELPCFVSECCDRGLELIS